MDSEIWTVDLKIHIFYFDKTVTIGSPIKISSFRTI